MCTIIKNANLLFISSLLLAFISIGIAEAKTTVNVAKHVVKGSGVTPQQMEDQFKKYKETWDSAEVEHKQVGKVNEVNNVNEGRVAGAMNWYGTPLAVPKPGNPGKCWNRRYIEIGPACPNDTGAHEGGHWGGALPDSTTDPNGHGTAIGKYPGDPNYKGYDTDGDGDTDANDANNISFPGTARKGSNVDPNQRKRYEENMKKWVDSQKAIKAERGKEQKDMPGDALPPNNIAETVVWGTNVNELEYMLYFEVLMEPQLLPGSIVGFYLETDQMCSTGNPAMDGIDYYLGYDTNIGEVILQRYDGGGGGGGWVTVVLPPEMLKTSIEYMRFDGPFPQMPIGVTLSMPLGVLVPPSQNNLLSYKAVAQASLHGPIMDALPNIGLSTILITPLPPEGITGDLDEDNDVDFVDFAYFAGNWLVGK